MLISITDYAKNHHRDVSTLRKKCSKGNLPTAIKIANRWLVEENQPLIDLRTVVR